MCFNTAKAGGLGPACQEPHAGTNLEGTFHEVVTALHTSALKAAWLA